jgi:hypothetical protein
MKSPKSKPPAKTGMNMTQEEALELADLFKKFKYEEANYYQ